MFANELVKSLCSQNLAARQTESPFQRGTTVQPAGLSGVQSSRNTLPSRRHNQACSGDVRAWLERSPLFFRAGSARSFPSWVIAISGTEHPRDEFGDSRRSLCSRSAHRCLQSAFLSGLSLSCAAEYRGHSTKGVPPSSNVRRDSVSLTVKSGPLVTTSIVTRSLHLSRWSAMPLPRRGCEGRQARCRT